MSFSLFEKLRVPSDNIILRRSHQLLLKHPSYSIPSRPAKPRKDITMAITKDTASLTASIRSLRSLQLVPPPSLPPPLPAAPPQPGKPYQGDIVHHENWAPPAPYAPHAQLGINEETRDDIECRLSAFGERFYARDEAAESTHKIDGVGCQRKIPKVNMDDKGLGASKPHRIPKPRQDEAIAAHCTEKLSTYYVRSGSRSRSPSLATPENKVAPMKFTKREFARSRSTRDPPVLTHDRVNQHLKDQLLNHNSTDAGTDDNDSKQQGRPLSSKPSSSSSNKKVTMVGASKIYSRSLIPPTVYHNTAADLWIVTINTSSKVARRIPGSDGHASNNDNNNSVRAYTFRQEKEARASAYAIAPPAMLPFDQCKECTICATTFTLLKRPRHCRNCGIVICNDYGCCTTWPRKMIPETFNFKKERTVNVCTSCDVLTKRFKHALLLGQYGTAMELYLTGNVNLRVPFAFKGKSDSESMLPIHCAIEGKSEELLRWLIDVQYCPIHVVPTASAENGGVISGVAGTIKSLASNTEKKYVFVPTLKTSKGRSVLDIAMKSQDVGILRYLINEKDVSVYEVEDLELALGAVEALAKAGSSHRDLFMGKKLVHNIEKGRKTDIYDQEENVVVKRSRTTQRGTLNNSPNKARIHSHSAVSPQREKVILPRDIHGVEYTGVTHIGGYDANVGI